MQQIYYLHSLIYPPFPLKTYQVYVMWPKHAKVDTFNIAYPLLYIKLLSGYADDWFTNGRSMCYNIYVIMHVKDSCCLP